MLKKIKKGDLILFIILALLLIISFIYSLSLLLTPYHGVIARIEQDGILLDEILLSEITAPFEKSYYYEENKFNTVYAEPGRIRVSEANCHEQFDVHAGWLSRPGQTAICLPHRFVIILIADNFSQTEIDAVAR